MKSDETGCCQIEASGPRCLCYRQAGRGTAQAVTDILVFLVFVLIFMAANCLAGQAAKAPASPDIPSLLENAQKALDQKDFVTAAEALAAIVKARPDLVPAWLDLGYADSALHRKQDAVLAYRRALELKPDLFEARLNLGVILLEMNDPAGAAEQLGKATELKPSHPRARLYYARALSRSGQTSAAEKQFQLVVSSQPDLGIAHYDLGQFELSQKHYAEALAQFEKAAIDPKLPQAVLGMALAAEGLGKAAEASGYFEKYLAAEPNDLETRFHLAKVNLQLARNEQALSNLKAIYAAKPDTPGLAAALGDVNALLKNFPESEKFYREALAASPDEPDLHRAVAKTLLDEGKYPEAAAEYRTALKLNPQNRAAAQGLATALYLDKHWAETIPLLEALLKVPDSPPALYFALATCYDHLRARREALVAYERYLELSHHESPDQEWQAEERAKLLRREVGK